MDLELDQLSPERFEALCRSLLEAESMQIKESHPQVGDSTVDFVCVDDSGKIWVVECKHAMHSAGLRSEIRKLVAQRAIYPADEALLITSARVSEKAAKRISEPWGAKIWSRTDLENLLVTHPEVGLQSVRDPLAVVPRFRVESLELQADRGFEAAEIRFAADSPTVLIGNNGVGKTSVLSALATALSRWHGAIAPERKLALPAEDADIRNGKSTFVLRLRARMGDEQMQWIVRWERDVGDATSEEDVAELTQAARVVRERIHTDPNASLPISVYYPADRFRSANAGRTRRKVMPGTKQIESLFGALGTAELSSFHGWFRRREDLENQQKLRDDESFDSQLNAVRTSISRLTGFANVRIDRSRNSMVLEKDDETLFVNQLSDGERTMMCVAGDLARRLAIANPGMSDPTRGAAVVLIDEVELHLHPRWQRGFVADFGRVFPNCQFIVASHSPQVVSALETEGIVILQSGESGIEVGEARGGFGWDSNRILEVLFGVSERPEKVKADLHDYFRMIDDGNLERAESLRTRLESDLGPDEPAFAKADVLIRHRRRKLNEANRED